MNGRSLVYVSCNQCGCDVSTGVHNISRLVRCVECGLIFVNPRPDFAQLARQYEAEYFHCDLPVLGGYEDYEGDRSNILATFRRRIDSIRRNLTAPDLRERPRLLDVGCATGLFLEVARESGFDAEGLDISVWAADRARAKGFTVHPGPLSGASFQEARFDVVTLWDVIEHVTDPKGLLSQCRRIVAPSGLVVLSTPDAGSPPARLLRGRWLGFRSIDEHLYFFCRKTMGRMLSDAGLIVRDLFHVGKYLSLARLITRLRYYTRIGAVLLGTLDRAVPDLSFYVNPFDTMCIVAMRLPEPR